MYKIDNLTIEDIIFIEYSLFLYKQRLEDELVTSVLDYGRSDYLAEFYLLQEDYENGGCYYYIEDEEEFILN